MCADTLVPIRADDFEGRKRTVRYRDVKQEKCTGFNGAPDFDGICIYKEVINPETKEVLYTIDRPDIYRIGGKDGGKPLRNSLWGLYVTEWLATVRIADSDEVGIRIVSSIDELKDAVFVEEEKLVQIGRLQPKNRWVPVEYLGKGAELGIQ